VLVIALTGFIVKPQHAHVLNYKSQAIFEVVLATGDRAWQAPDHNIGELSLTYDAPFAKEQMRSHVGIYTNIDYSVKFRPARRGRDGEGAGDVVGDLTLALDRDALG
jgi:hypothetical protein